MLVWMVAAVAVVCMAVPEALAATGKSTVVLVKDGKPACSIVIAKNATTSRPFSADEVLNSKNALCQLPPPILPTIGIRRSEFGDLDGCAVRRGGEREGPAANGRLFGKARQ